MTERQKNLRIAEAVARLDALTGVDPQGDHNEADDILLDFVPPEIRTAYERLAGTGNGDGRAAWWATA